jgi:hypothetical protein
MPGKKKVEAEVMAADAEGPAKKEKSSKKRKAAESEPVGGDAGVPSTESTEKAAKKADKAAKKAKKSEAATPGGAAEADAPEEEPSFDVGKWQLEHSVRIEVPTGGQTVLPFQSFAEAAFPADVMDKVSVLVGKESCPSC